jgi:hypothetical protein
MDREVRRGAMDDGEEDVAREWELLLRAMDMELGGPGKMEPTPWLVSVCSKGAQPWRPLGDGSRCSPTGDAPMGRRVGSTGVEGAQRPWEAAGDLGDPALAAVAVGEEIRLLQREGEGGREWRLGNFEGWECKTAKGKGEGSVFIEKP